MLHCDLAQRQVLALLRAYCEKTEPNVSAFEQADWKSIWMEAQWQTVSGIVYAAAQRLPTALRPPKLLNTQWRQEVMQTFLRFGVMFTEQSQICEVLHHANIPVCIWKGIAVAIAYPEPELRALGDVDLLVPPESMEEATKVLTAAGYLPLGHLHENANKMHHAFEKNDMIFEVHQAVMQQQSAFINSTLIDARNSYIVKTDYGCFPALEQSSHASAMFLHMLRHFISSGFGLRQLLDWHMWLEYTDICKDEVECVAKAVGAEQFLYAITQICEVCFGLAKTYGWSNKVDDHTCDLVLEDILLGANWGMKEDNRTYSLVFGEPDDESVGLSAGKVKNKLDQLAEQIWPKSNHHPFVKPLLWLPAGVQFCWRVAVGKRVAPKMAHAKKIAKRRKVMFEQLDLSNFQRIIDR